MSYECRGMEGYEFLSIIEKKKRNTLIAAPWQRDDIWTAEKKDEFRKTVDCARCGNVALEGSMMTYHLYSELTRGYSPPTVWNDGAIPAKINDGMQRTYTGEQIFDEMIKNEANGGKTDKDKAKVEEIREIFKRIKVYVQYFVYETEEEAQTSFLRVNYGTGMTNYERGRTILTSNLKPFDSWLKLIEDLHSIIENGASQFQIKSKLGRNDKHKCLRDDLALLLRYLSEDTNPSNYGSSYKVELTDFTSIVRRKNLLEYKLCECLNDIGLSNALNILNKFRKFIDNETKLMMDIWKDIDKVSWKEEGPVDTVTMANYRWALALAIYRRNNDIPRPRYRELLKRTYEFCHGATEFINPKNLRNHFQLGLSNLNTLAKVQEFVGYSMDDKLVRVPERDKIKTDQIARGNVAAHDLPYATYGNGPVTSKPAIDNLSEGVNENIPGDEGDEDDIDSGEPIQDNT